jgi:hypothetical protein
MRFSFFERLSDEEARTFLRNFLNSESDPTFQMLEAAKADDLRVDFSLDSISPLFGWILARVRTMPRQPDETVPAWIRGTRSYSDGLFDFDEPSRALLMQAAFYLGESFARSSNQLSWSTGRRGTAVQGQPVVTGFTNSLELAPIMVTENLFRRILADGADPEVVDQARNAWVRSIPGGG